MVTLDTFKRGISNGFKTLWLLSKILVPVYLVITIIRLTPIIDWIAFIFKPIMFAFGLPGEAAIVLVLGNTLNLYAALGAIASLSLTAKQITILAIMLGFSHSLIVETAVLRKLNVKPWQAISFRVSLGIISGIVMNLLL